MHYHLVQLQQRVAGLATRALLDKLYVEGTIDAQEYLTVRLASGNTEKDAQAELEEAHKRASKESDFGPLNEMIEANIPQYSGPTRAARRPAKKGPELRGHPLDY